MQNINPLTVLRSLKGAPLSCLMALMFATQPVGKEWLSRITGYSDKPVAAALNYLLEMGFVTTAGRYESWQIKQNVFQLPIENENALPGSSRNYSDSRPTTTAINIDSNNKVDNAEVVEKAVEKIPSYDQNLKVIKRAGIGDPTASRLANMEHINPYYVIAHTAQARSENVNTGLLIHRMKQKDPSPQLNENYHLLGCKCNKCFGFGWHSERGFLDPDDFAFEDYLESIQTVDSYV